MDKYSISKKKVDELYDIVHGHIMELRVEMVLQAKQEFGQKFADWIEMSMSDICMNAPQDAINVFKIKER